MPVPDGGRYFWTCPAPAKGGDVVHSVGGLESIRSVALPDKLNRLQLLSGVSLGEKPRSMAPFNKPPPFFAVRDWSSADMMVYSYPDPDLRISPP